MPVGVLIRRHQLFNRRPEPISNIEARAVSIAITTWRKPALRPVAAFEFIDSRNALVGFDLTTRIEGITPRRIPAPAQIRITETTTVVSIAISSIRGNPTGSVGRTKRSEVTTTALATNPPARTSR